MTTAQSGSELCTGLLAEWCSKPRMDLYNLSLDCSLEYVQRNVIANRVLLLSLYYSLSDSQLIIMEILHKEKNGLIVIGISLELEKDLIAKVTKEVWLIKKG